MYTPHKQFYESILFVPLCWILSLHLLWWKSKLSLTEDRLFSSIWSVEIQWNIMTMNDMIYYMIWWTIQRGDMWCQKYSPPIVGAREIRYWRFQGSLLAVKFHPPLFLFLLLVHVNVVLVVSFFNTLRRWAIDTKSYFCSYSNNSTIYRHINPYQSLPTLGKTTLINLLSLMLHEDAHQTVFVVMNNVTFSNTREYLEITERNNHFVWPCPYRNRACLDAWRGSNEK